MKALPLLPCCKCFCLPAPPDKDENDMGGNGDIGPSTSPSSSFSEVPCSLSPTSQAVTKVAQDAAKVEQAGDSTEARSRMW